jgi:hypothetical protein
MHPTAISLPFLVILGGLVGNIFFGKNMNTRRKIAEMSEDDERRSWRNNLMINGAVCNLLMVVASSIVDEKQWHHGLLILGLVIYVFAAFLGYFIGKVYAIRRW